MRKRFLLSSLVALALGITSVNAQLYNYTNDLSGSPASVAANTSASSLGRVNGALASAGCADGFNSNKFSEGTVYATTKPAMEFSITANSGYQLDVTSLSVDARHNNKGPVTWRLAYSTDGGATWVDNGADYNVGAISCGTSTTLSWDMADFSTYNTLYVRVYAYAALSNLNGVATAKNVVLGGSVSFADVDGDGYTSDVDCNDADAAINPGASESCNGIDDNCDGNIDEGVQTTYYADMDGDTYGDAGNTTMACSMPEGYVADATDCNDADAAVNPAATEVCNGIDDNCDGNNDEGLTFTTYYADADGDTYGDAGSTVSTCDGAPEGYVSDATDCNDADAAVNPGATEICNGIDDNCDGNIDEGVQNTYYADMDGDTYGDASSTTMACSAPEGYVSDATDCNDADGAVNPGATEVCNGIDDNCDGNTDEGVENTYYADADGDTYGDAGSTTMACSAPEGYVSDATDCNDADGAVNPGAAEVCNGIDDNCDGNTDEGVENTYYADADGDTYGDAGSTTMACSAPEGYVSDATDCNDADGAVNPGATEVCNGIDDNCDGNTDEGVQNTYYADADGDTYGDAGSTTMACSAPEGYVSDATDCNDADGAVNPGATEVCNGIDDNCDGNIDEGLTFTTYYADADGDTYGDAASTVTTCDGAPEGYVSDATDCNDADGAVNPGATEVCNGIDDNCDGNIDEGVQTTYYADADGDTYGDAGSTTMACSAPEGYVADATDCNDADGAVNPGATEVCNGIDDNCDGNTDEGVLTTFYADADGDTHGDAAASVDACSAPEGYVASNDDCDDASSTVYPGAPEICNNGIDEDCDGGIDVISTIAAGGPTTFCLGNSVTLSSTTVGTGYGYQWMKNGSNIAGANSSSLNVTLQGNYKCTVTKGDCSSTSSVITVSVNLNPNATIVALDGTDLCGKSYVRLKANNGTGLTYQWYMDGVIIDGATGNVYYASLPGDYYVVVTNAAGCSKQTATVTVVSSCRIAEEGAVAFNVMPNPSNGNFQLNVNLGNGLNGNAIISVVNIAGQKVAQLNGEIANGEMSASVSIPQVAGVYMVVVEANGEVFSQQILITE
ncbi:MAG: T9SS type A sorting domain-containing protein [Bacteroidetes bacterium]|nr:T9SS type A sorting domain-containing protein [Bacteroidota bacterium]